MPKKLRCLQVGLGSFWLDWALAFERSKVAEYAGVCDLNEKVLHERGAKLGVPRDRRYTDLRRALKESGADFVLCVVPEVHHRKVILAALRAGKHVLTEKPMALTRADALACVREAERRRLMFAVDQNYRFNPWIREARRILASGRLGRVSHVVGSFRQNDAWGRYWTNFPQPLLTGLGIHHFDNLRYLLGEDAAEVFARTWNPAWSWSKGDTCAAVTVTMRSGVVCAWEGTLVARGDLTDYAGDWRIECERGALNFDFTHRVQPQLYQAGRLFVTTNKGRPRRLKIAAMKLTNQDIVLAEFVRSIRTGKPTETNGRDNLGSLAIMLAAVHSVKTGKPARVSM